MSDEDGARPPPAPIERRAAKLASKAIAAGSQAAVGGAITGAVAGGPPGAALGAGVAFLGGAGGELAKAAAESLRGATARLEEAVEREKAAELERVGPELSAKLDRLIEEVGDTRAVASDVAATIRAWSRAWDSTGHAKKRRVLMAALLNSFEREAYEEGLTLRLFEILGELDYPEIRFLRVGFNEGGGLRRAEGRSDAGPRALVEGAEMREYIERLRAVRLVGWEGAFANRELSGSIKNAERAWLGERLLALCADSDALSRVWPEPEEEGDDSAG